MENKKTGMEVVFELYEKWRKQAKVLNQLVPWKLIPRKISQSNTTEDETWKFECFPWKAIVIKHNLWYKTTKKEIVMRSILVYWSEMGKP